METATAPFEVRASVDRTQNKVMVAGQDITNITRSVRFDASGMDVPMLTVEVIGIQDGLLEGDAAITVVNQQPPTPAGALAALADVIRGLDPDQVRAAVAAACPTMGSDPHAAAIDVIADMVEQIAEQDHAA